MKKLRTLLVLAFMAICATIPVTAHADLVDEFCDEFGYVYRWTIDATLDETYDGTWLDDISDNGDIRISFIVTEDEYIDSLRYDRAVLILDGSEEVALAVSSYKNTSNNTYAIRGNDSMLVKEDGVWTTHEMDFGTHSATKGLNVGIYATGDEKTEKKFLMIHAGTRQGSVKDAAVTPIGLSEADVNKAEDTELSLIERRTYYIEYKGNRSPASYSPNGKVIWAKPVIREDKKSPIVSDNYFEEEPREDIEDNPEDETRVIYPPEKKAPEFDVTLKEAETAQIPQTEFDGMNENIGYQHCVLNGKPEMGNVFVQSVQGGKATFSINLPYESVADISSDGAVKISIQRYEVYGTYTPNRDMVFEPYRPDESADEMVINVEGDLGERAFYVQTYGEKQASDGAYNILYDIYPIFKMDEDVIVYESRIRIPREEATTGGFVDTKDENYIYVKGDIAYLYCQFADRAYCGIEKIGFKFGDDIYTVDIDDTKMDFDVEVDLSDQIIGTKAARKLLAEIRAERSKNSEVVNILENGKPDFNINIEPEIPEEPEEIPKEQIVSTDEIRVDLRGKFLEFADQKPIIENDRVLVPFRVIFEALEAEVFWDGDTRTVTATKGNITITLTIGKNEIVKNGEAVEIDVPAQIINSRTLVPVRVISESFENTVFWDGENKVVEIK